MLTEVPRTPDFKLIGSNLDDHFMKNRSGSSATKSRIINNDIGNQSDFSKSYYY